MHSKSDNIKIMINDEADEVIKELFDSLKNRYQNNLELMKGSDFVFDYNHLFYYKCHKINPNCGGSYIDSSDWIKNKQTTLNPINKKNGKFSIRCNSCIKSWRIEKKPEKITKINPLIDKYQWAGINFLSEHDCWNKVEKNNVTIALNVSYVKKEKRYPAYVSKHNSNRETQVILLLISNGGGRHYLAVKKLSALLRGITSKNNGYIYCLNCRQSFRTKNKLESHKKVCENKDFCKIIRPSEDNKLL